MSTPTAELADTLTIRRRDENGRSMIDIVIDGTAVKRIKAPRGETYRLTIIDDHSITYIRKRNGTLKSRR